MRQLDQQLGLTAALAAALPDERQASRVSDCRQEQLRQRVYQIAAGYEDCNDADSLRHDPLFKTVCERLPQDQGLSSQPTLSRFENSFRPRFVACLVRDFEQRCLDQLEPRRQRVVLDVDATDDPAHGAQQLTFFHGFYDQYMYHPLLVYDAEDGSLVTMLLRAARRFERTGKPVRLFGELRYAAEIWPRRRRVVVKAEHLRVGGAPRHCPDHPSP